MLYVIAALYGLVMRKLVLLATLLFLLILALPLESIGQCPMCRMAAESNLKTGGSAGKGLNNGILYLLATPYLLVLILAVIWRRHQAKLKASAGEIEP